MSLVRKALRRPALWWCLLGALWSSAAVTAQTGPGDVASEDAPRPAKTGPQIRGQVQAASRERSRQMADLASRLTQAAEAGDQPVIDRLLEQLESKAGSDSHYFLNMRAYVALVREDYAEVEALLGTVLARDPTEANAGLNMAVVESRTGRLKAARARLGRLALEHPDDHRIDALRRTMQSR